MPKETLEYWNFFLRHKSYDKKATNEKSNIYPHCISMGVICDCLDKRYAVRQGDVITITRGGETKSASCRQSLQTAAQIYGRRPQRIMPDPAYQELQD